MNTKLSILGVALMVGVSALDTNEFVGVEEVVLPENEFMMGWNPKELENFVYHSGYWFFIC